MFSVVTLTRYHSHPQLRRILFFLGPLQHLLLVDILMMAPQTSARCYLIIVLIYIFMIISDVKHLSMSFYRKKEKVKFFWVTIWVKLKWPLSWNGLLKLWPCFEFSFDYLPQHISSGQAVIYLKGLVSQKFTFLCLGISVFSVHVFLSILVSTSTWYHMLSAFLYLTCFPWYDHLQIHLCCSKWHYFIPFFYGRQYSFVYMYHILMHSSANGQFGGFHVLAIESSVAMALRFMCLSP